MCLFQGYNSIILCFQTSVWITFKNSKFARKLNFRAEKKTVYHVIRTEVTFDVANENVALIRTENNFLANSRYVFSKDFSCALAAL